jgi:hypothetical protein
MDDMMGLRWILLALLLAGWLGTSRHAGAQSLETMPGYSDARAFREDASLRAVAFGSESIGVACGDRGAILRSEDGGQTWTHQESGVDCSLNDVIWIDRQRVVIVGGNRDRITQISRSVVLVSEDAGARWQKADDEELPRLTAVRLGDGGSLVARGDWSHSLLSREFESHDRGRTWQSVDPTDSSDAQPPEPTAARLRQWATATGVSAAIRDACRVNTGILCAVGDHGVIVLSEDGGQSWNTKRGQQRRTAILFVAGEPASVAWSLLGSEALEARNRVALLLAPTTDPHPSEGFPIDLARQVTAMLGGSGADVISSDRGRLNEEAGDWIAVHRPSALVLDQSLPSDIRDAFFQAATSAGVTRVITYSHGGGRNTSLHRDALLPKAGVLASDLLLDAMHYVAPNRAIASSISLNYLYDAAPTARRGETVVGGLSIEQGQLLAAPPQPASRRQLQITQARLNQSERVSKLIRSSRTTDQFARAFRATLDQTAREDRFRLAWSVLQQTASGAGPDRHTFHQQALEEFASRFPATSAGRWAKLRGQVLRHSLEWRHLRSTLTEATTPATGSVAEVVAVSPFQVSPSGVRQASAVAPIVVPKPELHELAPRQAQQSVEVDLAWEFHPMMLISQDAARRRGDDGGLQVAGEQSANLKRLAESDLGSWSWLLQPGGPQVVVAHRADSRPRLDGIINDPCWQSELTPAGPSQRLHLAYDDDYVYVAIECPADLLQPDQLADGPASSLRDQNLTQVDRMRLRIDTDRDLATSMQLQVTDAGRTHDSIDRNPRWHPTWYVDTERTDDHVVFEMAILRRDLVELPILEGESWFVSAVPLRAGSESNETVLPEPSQWRQVIFQR